MMQPPSQSTIEETAAYLKRRTKLLPEVIIITGSGLAALAQDVRDGDSIPYGDIPGFPVSTVEGHPGELVLGSLEGRAVAIQRGRVHFYEGYSLRQLTLPVRVLRALGASTLIVTNAAGGVNPNFRAGDLMLITDHIGLPAMAGNNPLYGPNDVSLGPRFPVMGGAYDRSLRQTAMAVAAENGFELREGIYAWVAGPSFETPAEIRFLRAGGADAVGMSTVPEVLVARHGGMRVLGISLITNVAADHEPTGNVPSEVHHEVLDASARAVPRLTTLIKGVLRKMGPY
jgi:purine-nucleoside phosphorylase